MLVISLYNYLINYICYIDKISLLSCTKLKFRRETRGSWTENELNHIVTGNNICFGFHWLRRDILFEQKNWLLMKTEKIMNTLNSHAYEKLPQADFTSTCICNIWETSEIIWKGHLICHFDISCVPHLMGFLRTAFSGKGSIWTPTAFYFKKD